MANEKILVVDDEEHIAELISYNLTSNGYKVITANNGNDAVKLAVEEKPNLILLDLMIPGKDGYDVCKDVRSNSEIRNIPIIMLTAKSEELDKILGLELGADDYITKPFDIREVITRIRVALRLREEIKKSIKKIEEKDIIIDNIKIIEECRIVTVLDKEIQLKPREFELLLFLSKNPNKVYSRNQLLDLVWGYDYLGDTRTVDVHITRLRQKVGKELNIETVFGVGYILKVKDVNH